MFSDGFPRIDAYFLIRVNKAMKHDCISAKVEDVVDWGWFEVPENIGSCNEMWSQRFLYELV